MGVTTPRHRPSNDRYPHCAITIHNSDAESVPTHWLVMPVVFGDEEVGVFQLTLGYFQHVRVVQSVIAKHHICTLHTHVSGPK